MTDFWLNESKKLYRQPLHAMLWPQKWFLTEITAKTGGMQRASRLQPVEKVSSFVVIHGHVPGMTTPIQQKGAFECASVHEKAPFCVGKEY